MAGLGCRLLPPCLSACRPYPPESGEHAAPSEGPVVSFASVQDAPEVGCATRGWRGQGVAGLDHPPPQQHSVLCTVYNHPHASAFQLPAKAL